MHLDDWISPSRLVGPVRRQEDRQRLQQVIARNNWMQLAEEEHAEPQADAGHVFEVKLNVSDFDLHELKVKICFGLVIITGQHEEDLHDPEHDRWGHEFPLHGSRRFKRTVTLPRGVDEDQLQAALTPDGYLILYTPAAAHVSRKLNSPPFHPQTRTTRLLKDVLREQMSKA
jgi:HSP20 family molecular chaperone IbpA